MLELLEQPDVLDRDDRLIGKCLQECYLRSGERPGFWACDADSADRVPFADQGNGEYASVSCGECGAGRCGLPVFEHVGDLDDAARQDRARGTNVAAGGSREDLAERISGCRG